MSDFLEKNLRDIIFDNKKTVESRGFPPLHKILTREYLLPSGKYIDLFSFEVDDDIFYATIYELKREKLTEEAFLQVIGYGSEVFRCASPHFKMVEVNMCLIGTSFNSGMAVIMEQFPNVDVYLYSYGYDGIKFRRMQSMLDLIADNEEARQKLLTPSTDSEKFYKSILKRL